MILYYNITNTYDYRLKVILTFKCNFNCTYCALKYPLWKDVKKSCRIRTANEWANALNKVRGHGIVFNGGEPTQYPELYDLLAKIRPDIGISLYTNMSFDVRDFIKNVKRKMGFLLSYHPDYGDVDKFIENLMVLKSCERFSFVLHGIKTDLKRDIFVAQKFIDAGIPIHLERDCNEELKGWMPMEYMEHPRKVTCKVRNYVFAPDGSRYPCACRTYRLVKPLENICDGDPLGPEEITVNCDDFGWCHLADVKENVVIKEREL